ncbi:MAG TPA: alpha/beta hydrolase family protein [bacterium]|nr:alpha/beta hydrolase family protein [bacterium]
MTSELYIKRMLVTFLAVLFVWTSFENPVLAQEDLSVIAGSQSNSRWLKYTDAENALYHHLADQAYQLLDQRAERVAQLKTRADWQNRQEYVRETLDEIVGPFPERTPLNARVVGTAEKDEYRIEHIIYESQPGFYVTSSLFLPRNLQGRTPAVIYCSGHTIDGYRSTTYQHIILNLVKKGFVVFAFDPVGQGERLQYFDPEIGETVLGGSTNEHSYGGAQAFISGSSQAMYMTWDGIRAVDYLLTRPEVDPDRIGITGRSGGGTQSAYIAAMDERIYAAAPECYITSFRRLLQSIGPQDGEQNMYQFIEHGLDHPDYLEVRAPKPTMMITTTRDFFSIQGARETAAEVQRAFDAFGQPERFRMVEDDAPHMSTEPNREAMYAFFQEHLNLPGSSEDEEVELLTPEELQVTETGQVLTSLESEIVYSLNKQETADLIDKLDASRENLQEHLGDVVQEARSLSGYRPPEEIQEPIFTGRFQREGYVIEKYYVQGEGNYIIPYLLFIPRERNGHALLYLHPQSKSAQAGPGEEIEWFVQQGHVVLAPDLVGIGEMGPGDFRGDAFIGGVSYNVWFASILIGRSIVGVRTGDIMRLLSVLKQRPEVQSANIGAVARQEMAPVLLHAAAFEPSLTKIALIGPLISYRTLVMDRRYNSYFIHAAVPGALTTYDLPDLAASLAPRKLLMANVTDEDGNLAGNELIETDLQIVKNAYQAQHAGDQLTIRRWQSFDTPDDVFGAWLE